MIRTLALALLLASPARAEDPPTVFAAASLTDAMKDVAAAWVKLGHSAPVMSFASSSTLARQIEQGAGANLFASADEQWMDELDKKGLLAPGTRKDLLSNDLVLVMPAGATRRVTIGPGFDVAAILGSDGKLAVGDPAHVPAGIYAEQALRKLGAWDAAEPRLARADSVRSALLLVERGEAPAGIVYGTDAAVSPGVSVAGVFPADSHDPIRYPFALVKGAGAAEAQALLDFIEGPEGAKILAARGFKAE
jgi:molybdate transport system substrate-binding protein